MFKFIRKRRSNRVCKTLRRNLFLDAQLFLTLSAVNIDFRYVKPEVAHSMLDRKRKYNRIYVKLFQYHSQLSK